MHPCMGKLVDCLEESIPAREGGIASEDASGLSLSLLTLCLHREALASILHVWSKVAVKDSRSVYFPDGIYGHMGMGVRSCADY